LIHPDEITLETQAEDPEPPGQFHMTDDDAGATDYPPRYSNPNQLRHRQSAGHGNDDEEDVYVPPGGFMWETAPHENAEAGAEVQNRDETRGHGEEEGTELRERRQSVIPRVTILRTDTNTTIDLDL
jgi:hypothetical protein